MKDAINMAERIELWPIEKLKPYANNPRVHSKEQIEKIRNSILRFGFTNPILVDSNKGIIAGHGRYEAALGLEIKKVPVIVLDHLTERERRAYVIADNKLALMSEWDEGILDSELKALMSDDFDMTDLGFSDEDLARLSDDLDGKFLSNLADSEPESGPESPEGGAPESHSHPESGAPGGAGAAPQSSGDNSQYQGPGNSPGEAGSTAGLDGPSPTDSPTRVDDGSTELVGIHFVIHHQQKETIYKALNQIKETKELESIGEALFFLAKESLNE